MNVSAWSIKNPIPTLMIFVLLTLAGILSWQSMKVQNFPDLDLPTVNVVASLPGAAPGQLENEVARKIENSIAKSLSPTLPPQGEGACEPRITWHPPPRAPYRPELKTQRH